MKGIVVLGLLLILFFGCIGSQSSNISQGDLDKLLNGTDKKNISVDVLMYHGEECPHCKNMINLLNLLNRSYSINMTLKETWHNQDNAKELVSVFDKYNVDANMRGVPVMIVDGKMMIVGEISLKNWISTIENCSAGNCQNGAFFEDQQTGNLVR
jgi:glutaredoxin